MYAARVQDKGTAPLRWGGAWHPIRTLSNPDGEWSTRAAAEAVLKVALAQDPDLIGHTHTYTVDVEPTLETISVSAHLKGDVVPVADVPVEFRDDYRDTLRRAALAAYRYGQPVWVNDSFRTRAEQQRRWNAYLAGGPLAARPGTSDHERGLSLDIPNARQIPALISQLRKLNMIDNVSSEVWHVTNMARKG